MKNKIRLLSLKMLMFLAVVSSSIAWNACANPSAPGADTAGTPIPYETRTAIMDSLQAQFSSLLSSDPGRAVELILLQFKGHPEFRSSGMNQDGLGTWGVFTDGRTFIVSSNRAPGDNGIIQKTGAKFQSPYILPPGSEYTILNALGTTSFGTAHYDISNTLFTAGYKRIDVAFTPRALKTRINDILYISTHGCVSEAIDLADKDRPRFSLWTDEIANATSDKEYDSLLRKGYLYYKSADYEKGVLQRHYAITQKFVMEFMQFGPSTIIYNDACSSADEGFRSACLAKGASYYFGWTHPVDNPIASRAARTFFSCAVGSKYSNALHKDPTQRPFDVNTILQDMRLNKLLHDDYSRSNYETQELKKVFPAGSDLEWDENKCSFAGLAPSIEYIEPLKGNFATRTYSIVGNFSYTPGKVTIDGIETPFTSWDIGLIRCTLPDAGPGSAGNVVVISAHGIKSNPVPLTEWRTMYTFTKKIGQGGTGLLTVTWNLHLRADVHRRRLTPGDVFNSVEGYSIMVPDSKCHFEFSGDNISGGTTYSYRGTGDLQVLTEGMPPTTPFFSVGFGYRFNPKPIVQADTNYLAVGLAYNSGLQGIKITKTANTTDTTVIGWSQITSSSSSGYTNEYSAVDYSTFILSGGVVDIPGTQGGHLEWNATTPNFPPTPETPGIANKSDQKLR